MRYYMHEGPAAFRFEQAGDLGGVDGLHSSTRRGRSSLPAEKRSREMVESITRRSFTGESTHCADHHLWFSFKSTPLGDSADRKVAWS